MASNKKWEEEKSESKRSIFMMNSPVQYTLELYIFREENNKISSFFHSTYNTFWSHIFNAVHALMIPNELETNGQSTWPQPFLYVQRVAFLSIYFFYFFFFKICITLRYILSVYIIHRSNKEGSLCPLQVVLSRNLCQ